MRNSQHRIGRWKLVAIAAVILPVVWQVPVGATRHAVAPTLASVARQAAPPQATPVPMVNADVVTLVKAGLGEAVIVGAIRSAPAHAFDLGPDGLVALKQAGVTDAVILVMQNPTVPIAAAGASSSSTASAGPLDGYESGIYLDHGDSKTGLTLLEPTAFSQGKAGGMWASALTYGIYKAKWKAVVRGAQSNIRTKNQQPTFYFRFEATGTALGSASGAATSPNEFVLVQMFKKKDSRELIVGEAGALGANAGTRPEDTVPFNVEKIGPGQYRVTPLEVLGPGEFCFFNAAGSVNLTAGATGRLFDFGVERVQGQPGRK